MRWGGAGHIRLSHHSPLEGESQKPSREAKADAVGGLPPPRKIGVARPSLIPPPARLRAGTLALPFPLKGGVIQEGVGLRFANPTYGPPRFPSRGE